LFWTLRQISGGFWAAWFRRAGVYFHGNLVARCLLSTILAFRD